ncbi:MAG: iron-sulfur cluster assembly accessory protein [Gammaproteobacteria bacterium]|nr:iron-sulfur cluster assembly accessory protein [Gammaproteobacteria bacterium]
MITITPAAARQIQASAEQGNMQGLAMRVAAKRNPDGTIHYGMGFDDDELDGDMHINAGGIEVVIGESSHLLMEGTTLDYVEIEPDSWQFIFMNPNDTNYSPPA